MRRIGLAVFLVSLTAVSYEILLMRLLSMAQWHHFAAMIISLALLGYGAAGTFLARLQRFILPDRFVLFFVLNSLLLSAAMVGCFLLAQRIAFNPLEFLWSGRQLVRLLGTGLLLLFPFFCAANCLCSAFVHFRGAVHRMVRFDLLGAGCGAAALTVALTALAPLTCLRVLTALGVLSAALAATLWERPLRRMIPVPLAILGILLPFLWPPGLLTVTISEYKGLRAALRIPGTRVIAERFSPLGWLSVVESPRVPFRYAPGLSLNWTGEPPAQLGLFTDGDGFSPITRFDGDPGPLHHLEGLSGAAAFHLLRAPEVLVLGAGGGPDVLMALTHGARSVQAVEINPQVVELVRDEFAEYSGGLYTRPEVRIAAGDGRGFLAGTKKTFDLIQLSLLDSHQAAVAGSGAISPSYLYTVEAFGAYLERLRPNGLLTVTRWMKMPPRDGIKLFATAVKALQRRGVQDPGRHLAMLRSWKTTTLVVKREALTADDIGALRAFCIERAFDTVYFPGITREDANRFNVLREPVFFDGVRAILGPTGPDFLARYKFRLEPATDDRPFFMHFFRWRSLPEIWGLRGRGGLPLLEWGYPVLLATLLQAILLSLLLVVLPLAVGRRGQSGRSAVLYFPAIGLGFMFVEMAFIQKLTLLLHHPVYSVAAVLCAFLLFAGLGSGWSQRWIQAVGRFSGWKSDPILAAVAAIGALALCNGLLLPALFAPVMGMPTAVRFLVAVLWVAPLAFFMGMPLPIGLSRLAARSPDFIPWAWGLNACASVVGAVLATVLAIHWGFRALIGTAVLLYVLAALVSRGEAGAVGWHPEPD